VIWTDAEPYIDTNNRTMTPFRVVGDALGLTIAWDSATREASFSNGAKTIWFPIGSTTARTSEGQTVEMDTSAVIVNGRTYAPVRYLAEYFGYGVEWDKVTRTVVIE
jgi:N-acetylmuramoyl-L-alanine amidase